MAEKKTGTRYKIRYELGKLEPKLRGRRSGDWFCERHQVWNSMNWRMCMCQRPAR